MNVAIALALVIQGTPELESSPTCLFVRQGIEPIVDLFQVPPGPRSNEAFPLLDAHARAHKWKQLLAESPPGPACPGSLLDRIHSAAVAPGVDRHLLFEPRLLAELLSRNGRADEARELLARQDPFLPEEGLMGRKTEALGTWGDVAFLDRDWERALATYREWNPYGKCGNYWNPPIERRLHMIEACLERLEQWDELLAFSLEAALSSPIDGLCHAEVGLDVCRRTGRDTDSFLGDLRHRLEERFPWRACIRDSRVEAVYAFAQIELLDPPVGECVERVVRHAQVLALGSDVQLERLSELLANGPAHVDKAVSMLARVPEWIDVWLERLGASSEWKAGEIGVLRALARTRAPAVKRWLDERLLGETRSRERTLLESALDEWLYARSR